MAANLYSEARQEERSLPVPTRALTIGAHPDDAEFGAGGTLARWAGEGCEVSILVVTDGSKGTWDPHLDPVELVRKREAEQRRAAAVLGARGEIVMLGHPDGEITATMELREQLCLWIRRLRPDVVLTHDPWKRYMLHPDHRVTGISAVDGVVAARDHLFFTHQLTGGMTKHRPEAILFWAADEPDHREDITDTFEAKVEALLCHSSQGETTMGDAHDHTDARLAFERRIRDWATGQADPPGSGLVEAFKLVRP
ncbi:MAG: PIG-L deacetylase family protein [Acidimicrobiia bacterium]